MTRPAPLDPPRTWLALAVLTTILAAGCSTPTDPLGHRSKRTPTVLVEIVERPTTTLIATAVTDEVEVLTGPSIDAERVARFDHPIATGAPLVFQVVRTEGDWLEVLLPIRPNGSTGWIAAQLVELSETSYRIEINVSRHRMIVWQGTEIVVDTEVAIGTGSTPTPIGSFFLTELLRPPDPSGPYGTHAYGLSGFSETLTSFRGGDGVIGIHGTNDPSSLGADISHGCVRVHNETIDDMATYLPLGTPVEVI